jgi:hypothetical protein
MVKKELVSHFLLTLIWLVLITLLRWQWDWYLIWFWLGGAVGTFLLDIDHLFYTLVLYPQEVTSVKVKQLLVQKKFKEAFILLVQTHDDRIWLSFHNALFQTIFMIFCFWVVTSSPSWLGRGIVMAMALHLLKDELEWFFYGRKEGLRQLLFWPIKKDFSLDQVKNFLILMILLFLGLSLLLI